MAFGKWFYKWMALAMVSNLAVILANLWFSQFEPVLSDTSAQPVIRPKIASVATKIGW